MQLDLQSSLKKLNLHSKPFLELFQHGTLTIELYKPENIDSQLPHTRDEVYVIVSGSGKFLHGKKTLRFNPFDVLFVPAGVEHRFFDFTDDFCTWVIFYGPEGGEK